MPTTIKLKNSVTTTNVPSSLAQGEVAINVTDKKVWVGNAATTPVQLLGGGADGSFTNISVSSVATFGAGTVSLPSITTSGDTNTGIFFPAADTIAFTEGGTEAMRITSAGNVGIGTSSPNYLLSVQANSVQMGMSPQSGIGYLGNYSNAPIGFVVNNSEKMRLDTSGNLGLGVTPSAWLSSARSFDVSGYSSYANFNNATGVINNAFYNASSQWIYKNTAAASNYYQISGSHVWLNAPSGTAGNAITFTQAMTLDASGNLGIGTSSPVTKLDISATANPRIRFEDTGDFEWRMGIVDNSSFGFFSGGSVTERMRIDSSGNVGIGTNSPATIVHAQKSSGNTYYRAQNNLANVDFGVDSSGTGILWNNSNYPLAFGTNNTERMRIDSSGYVGINTSSPSAFNSYLTSVSTANNKFAGVFYGNAASNDGQAALQVAKSSATNTSSQIFVEFFINAFNTASGRIAANGASAAAFVSYSDRNLKENIVALPSQLGNILALKPSEFDYKDGAGHQIGFIAQEFKEVYPDCVTADNKGILSIVGWSKTEARLVKAIQEQQAIINDLKARIETLESK